MVIEPPACSKDAQKKTVINAKTMIAIMRSRSTGVYCEILFIKIKTKSSNAKTTTKVLPDKLPTLKSNKLNLEIFYIGSFIIQAKPRTETIPIKVKSIFEKGLSFEIDVSS